MVTSTSLGDKIISRDIVPFMRSRNIEIITNRMKPRTRFYAYFDNIDVTLFTTPKLLEVNMTNGVFTTGETVRSNDNKFVFRLATSNHKEGPYNAPTKTLTLNPYVPGAGVPASYSTSTTLLNVDTFSLATQVQGNFFGNVVKNMKLIGQTSGAEATVTDVRLISDSIGSLTASYNIPNPNIDVNPRFETGTKTIRLTTSPTNSNLSGTVTGAAEANFAAAGAIETTQESILSTKVPQIERLNVDDQRVINNRITRQVASNQSLTGIRNIVETQIEEVEVIREVDVVREVEVIREVDVIREVEVIREVPVEVVRTETVFRDRFIFIEDDDPLAQTFTVNDTSGIFITSVDCFFQTKDDELPVTLQIRTVETGLPTSKILPFSVVVKDPSEVNLSEDGSAATTFTFDSPIYLQGETRYALVLISASENYNVWISRMGEVDISTVGLPDEQQVIISQQPYLLSLIHISEPTRPY